MKKQVCKTCSLIYDGDHCPDCQCTCGFSIAENYGNFGICKVCDLPVCEDCQAPIVGPPNPTIDYAVHKLCLMATS